MKVLFDLPPKEQELLKLGEEEEIRYCVPYDLDGNRRTGEGWIVVTDRRLLVLLSGQLRKEFLLSKVEKVRCEPCAGCGLLTVWQDGEPYMAARLSLAHIERVSCAARGAEILARGGRFRVESPEPERYCQRCGRALSGSSQCTRCDGKKGAVSRFLVLCQGCGKLLVAIAVIMLVNALVGILIPQLESSFIDRYLRPGIGGVRELVVFTVSLFLMSAMAVVTYILRNWWCARLASRLSMNLRSRLYEKLQHLSMTSLNQRKPGELMNRISGDTEEIRRFIDEVFGRLFSMVFILVLTVSVMLYLNPFLTLVAVIFTIMAVVLNRLFWKRIHRIYGKLWRQNDVLQSSLEDTISGIRVVKAFGREAAETEKFVRQNAEYQKLHIKNECFWAVLHPIISFFMSLGIYLVTYFGGRLVLLDSMSMGQLVQFIAYAGALYGPISWMSHLPRGILQMLTSLNRVYDVLDEEPRLKDAKRPVDMEIRGDVELQDVSFGYHSYEPVLEHIDLTVKQGEMIGLVGPSGAGKSTVINLIMRLYDPDTGRILVDGVDLKDIRQETLHSQIGVVLQETFLFSGSILDNIRFARQDASLEEIIQAAKAANAHDFITRLPDGYHTWVGEHGYTLSGGERQRIAIARAVLTNPRILILDEATSALDTESEYLIQQALSRLIAGRTTFAIAHRLSTLREADRLVVIDRHGIAEVGTHNQLLEKKGIYYGLVTAQLELAGEA